MDTTVDVTVSDSSGFGGDDCIGPFPQHPRCSGNIELILNKRDADWFTEMGLDGSRCSVQMFLHEEGGICPMLDGMISSTADVSLNPSASPGADSSADLNADPSAVPSADPSLIPSAAPSADPTSGLFNDPSAASVSASSCNVTNPDWLGDAWCDGGEYNTEACNYDGGDCCEASCESTDNWYDCGINGYDCVDVAFAQFVDPSADLSADPIAVPTAVPSAVPSAGPSVDSFAIAFNDAPPPSKSLSESPQISTSNGRSSASDSATAPQTTLERGKVGGKISRLASLAGVSHSGTRSDGSGGGSGSGSSGSSSGSISSGIGGSGSDSDSDDDRDSSDSDSDSSDSNGGSGNGGSSNGGSSNGGSSNGGMLKSDHSVGPVTDRGTAKRVDHDSTSYEGSLSQWSACIQWLSVQVDTILTRPIRNWNLPDLSSLIYLLLSPYTLCGVLLVYYIRRFRYLSRVDCSLYQQYSKHQTAYSMTIVSLESHDDMSGHSAFTEEDQDHACTQDDEPDRDGQDVCRAPHERTGSAEESPYISPQAAAPDRSALAV